MAERKSDRWISLTQSVLLHGVVIGALAYGFYAYKKQAKPPPPPTLAIEGTVVGEKDLQPVQPKAEALPAPPEPQPEPPPPDPPPEDQGPPSPSPEEIQQREHEEQQQRQAEEERVALEKRQADETEQKAREDTEKKRQQEQREAEQKRIADAKKKAEDKRKADDEKRKADEAKARAASEAELRKSLEAEERVNTLRSSGAMVSWIGQIANRIQRAWIKPPSAKPGLDCVVHVTQVPGGAVTSVKVGECNGDGAVRESIESAVIRASPLPPPPDPSLFERDLEIRFRPTD